LTGTTVFEQVQNIDNFSSIASKTRKSIKAFAKILGKISEAAAQDYPVESLIAMVLDESGYRNMLVQSKAEEDMERLANIEELLTEAREFDNRLPSADDDDLLSRQASGLEEFLEQAALTSDVDGLEQQSDRAALMTLHAAKGLEFPVVYIIAIEEGILPHSRSSDDVLQTEEERRLFFVGITRAEKELRLSSVNIREFRGLTNTAISSSFLFELPGKPSLVKYDSPEDIENIIDRGDGTYIVLEESAEETEEVIELPECEPVIEYQNEYTDIEYDEDGNPVLPESVKKKKEKKRTVSACIITAAELNRKKDSGI
jgi:DNA helicase-2/ATP-dependent DNA helicase PcrA